MRPQLDQREGVTASGERRTVRSMRIGFSFGETREPLPFGEAFTPPPTASGSSPRRPFKLPARLLDSQQRKEISGVVGSYETTRQTIIDDAADAVGILAIISLSLAIVNLFPFLPLDGGHIFWALVELIRRRAGVLRDDGTRGNGRLRARDRPVHHRLLERPGPAPERGLRAALVRWAKFLPTPEEEIAWRPAPSPARSSAPTPRASRRRRSRRPFSTARRDYPERVAIRTKGDEYSVTWGEHAENVRRAAAGLAALGLERGQTIALMLTNRPEFHTLDAAAMHLGATPFSVYNTYSPEQIEYLFCGRREQDRDHRAGVPRHDPRRRRRRCAGIEHVVVVDGTADGHAVARANCSTRETTRSTSRLPGVPSSPMTS